MKVKLVVALVLAIVVSIPSLSMGIESKHFFDCGECHLSNASLDVLGGVNVCLRCHDEASPKVTTLNAGSRYNSTSMYNIASTKNFDIGDCSDVYNSGVIPAAETSHHWAVSTTYNSSAGSSEPNRALYPNMYSQYNISTGKVTCSRCHDPHGDFETNPKLLRLSNDNLNPMTENELCEACHRDFAQTLGAVPGNNAFMTHPIMNSIELTALTSGNPAYNMTGIQNYNSASPYTNSVVLVNDGISCSSCHSPHFTDSNALTPDGPGVSGGPTPDGLLLRSDGPLRIGADRNATAQLRSNLCQSCHTYKLHGAASSSNRIGCLDCHGGHSYNNNAPSHYVLADVSPTPVPTYNVLVSYNAIRVFDKQMQVDYPVYNAATADRESWSDQTVGTTDGFCEKCHGDIEDNTLDDGGPTWAVGNVHAQHKDSGTQSCVECHNHGDPNASFDLDESAATCGDCHGFPPFVSDPGNRKTGGTDGGYAYDDENGPKTWNYNSNSLYYKDEAFTAHKTHSGGQLTQNDIPVPGRDRWYTFFDTGLDGCKLCHSGFDAGHKEDPTSATNTYRDVPIDTIAGRANAYNAIGTTAYNWGTATCTDVYCHSAGGPRDGAGGRDFSAGLQTTVAWVGTGGAAGYNSITVSGTRCRTCHGNDTGTMSGKNNTWEVHDVHFNSASIGTNCSICHFNSAADWQTLSSNAKDHTSGSDGDHVNGIVDVVYNTALYNGALLGETYDANGDGTCSVYCHDVPDPVNTTGTGRTADWDAVGSLGCNDCHFDQTANFSVGHEEHSSLTGNSPKMSCDECHGTGSETGGHAGHIDGVVTYIQLSVPDESTWGSEYPQNFCDKCHGLDAENGEVQPVWGDLTLAADPGKYCSTCHAGTACGGSFVNVSNGKDENPTSLPASRTGGHNRLAATGSGFYPVSGNDNADLDCDDCHVTDSPNHFDGDNYTTTYNSADLMLRTDDNFVAYAGAENDFCLNCHGSAPGSLNAATPDTQGVVTHSGKLCVACHTVHGDPVNNNIQMIWSDDAEQKLHDASPGTYANVNVVFVSNNAATLGAGSFDEDDGAAGVADENTGNDNDLCTVCHIDAKFDHNQRSGEDNQGPLGHNIETTCTSSCHTNHYDDTEAFVVAAGDSCDDCHGYPPSLAKSTLDKVGAHGDGTNLHTRSVDADGIEVDKDAEDRDDCAYCHAGADLYTYNLDDDQTAGGLQANHGNSDTIASLVATVGYNATNGSCFNGFPSAPACHASSASDGFWTDTEFAGNVGDGLNCDACHFYSGTVSSGDTPTPRPPDPQALATEEHDKHFVKDIQCTACHTIETYNAANFGLSHIGSFDFGSGADDNDGAALYDMATTEENESDASAWGVNGTDMVFNDTDNTCSGSGVAANCHATGTPDWDEPIPETSAGCLECHTDTTNPTFNPTTGLHNNTATLTVTGVAHDGDLDSGNGCITCHTDSPSSAHMDGSIVRNSVIINSAIIPTYNATELTCNTNCHSAGTTWAYKWTKDVYNSTNVKECNGCHGLYSGLTDSTGWTDGTIHAVSGYENRGSSHSDPGSLPSPYPCSDCHAVGAPVYNSFAWGSGLHGDGSLQLNNYNSASNTGWTYNSANLTWGCAASCHSDPPEYSFYNSAAFPSPDLVVGEKVNALCSGCHGGGTTDGDVANYWPDGPGILGDVDENGEGAHPAHIAALAKAIYNETSLGGGGDNDILTDVTTNNPGFDSDTKQQKLCTYCHGVAGDPIVLDHGALGDLPGDVSTMYPIWDTAQASPTPTDNGDFVRAGNGTCTNVDCHFNFTTPATNEWYDAPGNGNCAMCHDVDKVITVDSPTGGQTHDQHMAAQSDFGINTIVCGSCHDTATAWGTPGTPPATEHLDGTYNIGTLGGSSVDFTYNALTGCGTNACHTSGYSGNTGPYNFDGRANYLWTDDFADDCATCHGNPNPFAISDNSGTRHAEHMNSGLNYTCDHCHTSEKLVSHIDGNTDYNSATTNYEIPGCTNACHIVDTARGDWTDTDDLACTDCHNSLAGTYVGDNSNYQVSGLHNNLDTPKVTGVSHDDDFDGGNNCESCHTAIPTNPESAHINNLYNSSYPTINVTNNVAIFTDDPPRCATSCHSAGTNWDYLWTTDSYNAVGGSDIRECNGCHGSFGNGWSGGTIHADTPAKGGAHTATGNLDFPCTDCHTIGATTAVYDWTQPWDPTGANSHHGDGELQINSTNTAFDDNNNFPGYAGCDGIGCHGMDDSAHQFPTIAGSTNWNTVLLAGTEPSVSCSGCHGGGTPPVNVSNYWPDDGNAKVENDAGAHVKHIEALALAVYDENLTEILTNNGNGDSDVKQKALCAYCHEVGDVGHSQDTEAETLADDGSGYYSLWNSTTLDSSDYDTFGEGNTKNCTNVDCHNNRDTNADAANFSWYSGSTSECSMCHDPDDVINSAGSGGTLKGDTHVDHTSSFTNGFGIANIPCDACHDSGITWAGPAPLLKTPGGGYHMDGTMQAVNGSVSFTYNSSGCGFNSCHTSGDPLSSDPVQMNYPWGADAGDECGICHALEPTSTAHTPHISNTDYVPNGCNDCHTGAGNINHLNGDADYNSAITSPASNSGAWDQTCTNDCHASAANPGGTEWTDTTVVNCVDCHAGTYIGGNDWRGITGKNYNSASGLHATTALNVSAHNNNVADSIYCVDCHSGYDSAPPSHVDGSWEDDLFPQLTDPRFVTVGDVNYSELAPNTSTCAPGGSLVGCHSDRGNWERLWSTDADSDYTAATGDPSTEQAVCGVCHGYYASIDPPANGWRTGTIHATSGANKGFLHTDASTECDDCHGYPTSAASSHHEDGSVTMWGADGVNSAVFELKMGNHPTPANRGWYCSPCHDTKSDEDAYNSATHTFVNSAVFPVDYALGAGVGPEGGGCDTCHGDNAGEIWPQGTDRIGDRNEGLHEAHMVAMIAKGIGAQAACGYCHVNPYGPNHTGNGTGTVDMASYPAWPFKRIIGGGDDKDGIYNPGPGVGESTCSNIDCHFNNSFTPHWYGPGTINLNYGDTNVKPDPIAPTRPLLVEAHDKTPRALKVTYNSPGMDIGLTNTTAYTYDMRISTSDISSFAQFNTATIVGGVPSTYSYDELTEVHIENLNPALSYYVALRTQDTEGLWSDIVQYGSAVPPRVDDQAPMFHGADKATAGDEGASVNLWWTAAEDHSMYALDPLPANRIQLPIQYNIYLKSVEDGILDMTDGTGLNSAILWDKASSIDFTGNAIELNGTYTHSDSGTTTINNDITYQLGVRACDNVTPERNCDDNTHIVHVTPSAVKDVQQTINPYISSTGRTLDKQGTPAGGNQTYVLSANDFTLEFIGSTESHPMTYWVDNFVIGFENSDRTADTVFAQVGKYDGATTTCTLISDAASVSPALGKAGVINLATFKFGAIDALDAPDPDSDSFCIRVYKTGGSDINVFWGSATSRGDASVIEQITNVAPDAITPGSIAYNSANGLVEMSWTHPLTDTDGLWDVDLGVPGVDYDPVHYDIYGDNGSGRFDYVIAEEVDGSVNYYEWDPQASGITSGNLGVRIRPGDGFSHTLGTTNVEFTGLHTMTAIDNVAPAQITDLQVLPRPKKGTVDLIWTSPGDDYMNNGRALKFDIRYDIREIVQSGAGGGQVNFDDIPQSDDDPLSGQVQDPPYPDFGDHVMDVEVTGLVEGQNYYFAMRTEDEQGNYPAISLAKYNFAEHGFDSDQGVGGPRCGMCHATGPNVLESQGNHKLHGYTLKDCDKCHTEDPGGANRKVSEYGLDHQDGRVVMGYGPEGAVEGDVTGSGNSTTITYRDNVAGFDMYVDTNGFGGFGQPTDQYNTTIGFGEDDGSCFSFGDMGIGGCHGPAGTDPDGAGDEYPLFDTPDWQADANLDCGRCHGNPNRDDTVTGYPSTSGYKMDPYGRDYDGTLFNPDGAGIVPDQILGSPGADNRGGYNSASPDVDQRALIGQHEKHLNYSFRFSKGDSCNLCHKGHYADITDLDGRHGDGIIDVELDTTAAGVDAYYNSGTPGVIAGQCFSMDPYNCHPTAEAPLWDSEASFNCIGCHTMQSDIAKIGHFTDPAASIYNTTNYEGNEGNCTWCHFPGHPVDNVGDTALILQNNPQVGVNYKSGGIHLRKDPGNNNAGPADGYQTQAELCWGCHDTQSSPAVSEWGADDGGNNAAETKQTGRADYNYGMLTGGVSNWIGAEWNSYYSVEGGGPNTMFEYKTGKLQSYHTTNLMYGSSEITFNTSTNQYEETVNVDTVGEIQCHNCHDVHNMNFAKNDQMNGQPYLRGSWLSNPYPEDGAPMPSSVYTNENNYGNVPRGGTAYNNLGGFQIDQNNLIGGNSPTKGFALGNSAGLCTLCHGTDIDNMDNLATNGENLWLGTNGHSNSALGGTAANAADILSFSIRNYSDPVDYSGNYGSTTQDVDILPAGPGNPDMGYTIVLASGTGEYAGGFRSARSNGWQDWFIGGATLDGVKNISNPDLKTAAIYAYNDFDWGVSQDSGGIINKGYHAFSCSKCHTPHASRLPKLMITNCLDTRLNDWDDLFDDSSGHTPGWNLPADSVVSNESRVLSQDNALKTPSNFTSAQNCHRLSDPGQAGVAPPAAGAWSGPGGSTQYGGWNKVTPWTAPLP